MVRKLKDLTIHMLKSNMSLLRDQVIFVKDIGTRVRKDCVRLTLHGPLRLGNEGIDKYHLMSYIYRMKDIINRIAFNIGCAYGYIKIRCKLIKEKII